MIWKLMADRIRKECEGTNRAVISLHIAEAVFRGVAHFPDGSQRRMNESPADPALVVLFTQAGEQAGLSDIHLVAMEFYFADNRVELTAFGMKDGQKAHYTDRAAIVEPQATVN